MLRRAAVRVTAIATLTLATASAFGLWATTADAVSGIQTGYWSALPAAPQVPAGGYEVGSNASGAHAVAALRFVLGSGESATKLTLKVAHAEPADQVAIQACPVAAKSMSWQPPSGGGPGSLSAAPTPDCSNGLVGGALSADGSTLTFDLSLMSFPSGTVNVVLSPNQVASPAGGTVPQAPTQSYPTFDADFDPLTAAQITIETAPGSAAVAPPPVTTGTTTSSSAPAPAAAAAAPSVPLPPASTDTGAAAGAPPVVANQQPTNVAQSSPALVTKKSDLRRLFAVAMLSSDLLFGLLWLQRHRDAADGERPKLSIYDPPPVAPST